jgi:mannose-6-phosphate isomerase
MAEKLTQTLFPLVPQFRERVWGGQRLKASRPPIGEAWIAFEKSRVRAGTEEGRTVGELTESYGADFLGAEAAKRFNSRFPLLIKLLDCADWLSVQVHPDDEQARRLVGPEESGKTEAWHLLDVDSGATIIAGVKPGTTQTDLEAAIREGRILDIARRIEVREGETYLLPAGTLHSLGPGLLLYEVQQASDTTFRVYDWDRPAENGRRLHIEESIIVTNPQGVAPLTPAPLLQGTSLAEVVSCLHFELALLQIADAPFSGDTRGRAFELLTVIEGAVNVSCEHESVRIGCHETMLVAGGAGKYEIDSTGEMARVLRATVPV